MITPGEYDATISNVEISERPGNDDLIIVEWTIADGRKLQDRFPLRDSMMWKVKLYQKCAGLPHHGEIDYDPHNWYRARAKIGIIHEAYKGKTYNKVKYINPTGAEKAPPPAEGSAGPEEDIPF
jgi:hypothetical protein